MGNLQERIKQHLTANNISAAELERRTGIPHSVVNLLHGRSKNPSVKTAMAIAKELGCTMEELFNESPKSYSWQPELYKQAFLAVYQCIADIQLQPTAQQVAAWTVEVYEYALGSPDKDIDPRFVSWLLKSTTK